MPSRIVEKFEMVFPSVVAIVGCGGKTSLIKHLAESYQDKRVLISPTTKIFPIVAGKADCRGVLNSLTGKLEALPADELAALVLEYDLALLEADGSRSLPCKGWRENEPVVPVYFSHTIGIITMNALGKAATHEHVHNLPLFLSLTGLHEGEKITMQALQAMVCSPGGMFKNSVGKRILFINQVEAAQRADCARDFLLAVKNNCPGFFEKLLYGSVHLDKVQEVK